MLAFRVHQFVLRRRHYILLPKLTNGQMRVLAKRLEKKGYSVRLSDSLSAKSSGRAIRVDPSGLCWSLFDCSDEVLPAIPEILSAQKEVSPLAKLESLYFRIARSGRKIAVRLATRLESTASWDVLRASGDCALAPDEHAVALFLLRKVRGTCSMLTDFPGNESVPRVCGRKRYFESTVSFDDAESTLRGVGERASRNTYLPRDSVLRVSGSLTFSRDEVKRLFEGLGEWCYFAPALREKL